MHGPRDVAVATAVAAVMSGTPSTVYALATGGDPLAATRAAGTLFPGERPGVVRGAVAHGAVSGFWGALLGVALPRRRTAWWAMVAGLGIAAIDLGLVGRHLPAIRALPTAPQVADHLTFGGVFGAVLARRRRDR
ncbi:MAG: hypothetical protein ACRD29_10435 [Acidimicrobiales bacterium]